MSQPTDAQIDAAFDAANQFIKASDKSVNIDNATKLQFYALFKQATIGPCTGKSETHTYAHTCQLRRQAAISTADRRPSKVRCLEGSWESQQERCETGSD